MKKLFEIVSGAQRTGRLLLIAVIGLVVIVVGYGYYVFVTQVSGRAVVSERIDALYHKIQLQSRRHAFMPQMFSDYRNGPAQVAMAGFAGELVSADVRRIVIYNREETIVWASEMGRIGSKGGVDHAEIQRALKGEVVAAHPFGKRPLVFPRSDAPADIFIPIHADDGYTMAIVVLSMDFSDVVSFSASIAVVTALFVGIITALLWMFLHMSLHSQKDKMMQEEGRISSVLEQMPMGLAIIRRDGAIKVWNATMVALSGVEDARDVIGKNAFGMSLFKLLGLDASVRGGMSGKPFEADTRVTSMPHGQETWCHWRGIPIFTTGGKRVEYLLLLVNDITDKKRKSV